jgi:hypothetical protein
VAGGATVFGRVHGGAYAPHTAPARPRPEGRRQPALLLTSNTWPEGATSVTMMGRTMTSGARFQIPAPRNVPGTGPMIKCRTR